MNLIGYRTKIGIAGLLLAAILLCVNIVVHDYIEIPLAILCLSLAISIYGIYDRQHINVLEYNNKIDELKNRIKKPMLRGGP